MKIQISKKKYELVFGIATLKALGHYRGVESIDETVKLIAGVDGNAMKWNDIENFSLLVKFGVDRGCRKEGIDTPKWDVDDYFEHLMNNPEVLKEVAEAFVQSLAVNEKK